jgi:uncharacterized membrane protein
MAGTKPLSLTELRAKRRPVRNVNKEHEEGLSRMDRVALFITQRVGTMGFFLVIATWTAFWLGWNLLMPKSFQFDPPMAFAFWLFISNMIQILLMPLIMVGQNIQGKHSDLRAESDYEVNLKAEMEVEAILHHLEYQNGLIMLMLQKQGISLDEIDAELQRLKKQESI